MKENVKNQIPMLLKNYLPDDGSAVDASGSTVGSIKINENKLFIN